MNRDVSHVSGSRRTLVIALFFNGPSPCSTGNIFANMRAGLWHRLYDWIGEAPCVDHTDTHLGFREAVIRTATLNETPFEALMRADGSAVLSRCRAAGGD